MRTRCAEIVLVDGRLVILPIGKGFERSRSHDTGQGEHEVGNGPGSLIGQARRVDLPIGH